MAFNWDAKILLYQAHLGVGLIIPCRQYQSLKSIQSHKKIFTLFSQTNIQFAALLEQASSTTFMFQKTFRSQVVEL